MCVKLAKLLAGHQASCPFWLPRRVFPKPHRWTACMSHAQVNTGPHVTNASKSDGTLMASYLKLDADPKTPTLLTKVGNEGLVFNRAALVIVPASGNGCCGRMPPTGRCRECDPNWCCTSFGWPPSDTYPVQNLDKAAESCMGTHICTSASTLIGLAHGCISVIQKTC